MSKLDLQKLMGQIVTVSKELKRYDRKYRESVFYKSRAGWVVGKRTVYSGNIKYNYDEAVFIPTESHECILVAFWPTMNPVKVPLDGFVMGGEPYPSSGYPWKDEWKEQQRDIMKDWPRRANGQWKSYAEMTEEEKENLYK